MQVFMDNLVAIKANTLMPVGYRQTDENTACCLVFDTEDIVPDVKIARCSHPLALIVASL